MAVYAAGMVNGNVSPGQALAAMRPRHLVTCPRCGKRRYSTAPNARYCSYRCQWTAKNERRRVREAQTAQNLP